ncbi:MAG: hypothetical protein ABW321_08515 [Polyangiales bacterium]
MTSRPRMPTDSPPEPPVPPPDMLARLQAAMAEQPAPVRRPVLEPSAALVMGLLCVAPAILFANTYAKLPVGLGPLAFATLWPSALVAAVAAVGFTFWSRARFASGLGARIETLAWLAVSALPLGLLPLWHRSLQLAAHDHSPARIFVREPHCLPISTTVLLGSLYILSRGRKQSMPTGVGWRCAAIGAAAGAWTALAMLLYCPDLELGHLLLKHVAPVCAAPLLGWLLLRRYVRL